MAKTVRQLIEDRIESNLNFKEVAGAADLQSILKGRVSAPGCYIYKKTRNPGPNNLLMAVDQEVKETYGLVTVIKNVRDSRHGDSSDVSEQHQIDIMGQLLGWQPSTETEPMEYAGGRLISLLNGLHFWEESYSTKVHIRSTGD